MRRNSGILAAGNNSLWDFDTLGINVTHWWDGSDTANQVITGGKLSSWTDRAEGAVLAQTDANLRPTVSGGEVRFNGNNIHLDQPYWPNSYIENKWVLMLFRCVWSTLGDEDGSLIAIAGFGGGDFNRWPMIGYIRTGSKISAQWRNAEGYHEIQIAAVGDDVWHSVVTRRTATDHFCSVDGGTETSVGTKLGLGLKFQFDGQVGDYRASNATWGLDTFAVGQGDIGTAGVAKLHAWALWRRQLQTSLPSGHTYRHSKPFANTADQIVAAVDGEGTPGFNWDDHVWDETTHHGEALNRTGFSLTFEDTFDTLSVTDGVTGAGQWYAPARPDIHSVFNSPLETPNPFSLDPAGTLKITMQKVGATWYGGHMQTVNTAGAGFAQQYGYFEARMAFNKAIGWIAFWLISQNRYTDSAATTCEIDIVEAYGDNDYDGHHQSIHRWPAYRVQPGHLQAHVGRSNYVGLTVPVFGTNDMFDGTFHTYGCKITESLIIMYFDDKELSRVPTYPEAKTPLFILLYLTMQPGFEASAVTSHIKVDWVRAWQT